MSKELSAEWQQKINAETKEASKSRVPAYRFGYADGYENAAYNYVPQLTGAQERIKHLEGYLDRIENGAVPANDREAWSWIETARLLANEALSPNSKVKEDAGKEG